MSNCFCDYEDACACRGEFLPKRQVYRCNFGGSCQFQYGFVANSTAQPQNTEEGQKTPTNIPVASASQIAAEMERHLVVHKLSIHEIEREAISEWARQLRNR
jgi:hypothetical protein